MPGPWGLKTTLERYSTRNFGFKEYYKIILNILPEVEGLSSHESQVRIGLNSLPV